MSHVASGIVQRRRVGSPTKKSVLLFMAGCASDDGTGIWTSKGNIAADLEMGKSTVKRAIGDLEAAGLVSEVGQRKCRNGFTVEYRIHLDTIDRLPSTREPIDDGTGSATDGVQSGPGPEGTPTGSRADPHGGPERTPNRTGTIQEPPCAADAAPQGGGLPEGFLEKFRKLYPRTGRTDQVTALLVAELEAGTDPEDILWGARCYAIEQKGNRPRFVAYPENWLKERRWTNYPRPPEPQSWDERVADDIKAGRRFALTHVTAHKARELVARGLVTEEQCEAAGIRL